MRRFFSKYLSKFGYRWALGALLVGLALAQNRAVFHTDLIERIDIYFYGLQLRLRPPVLDQRIVIVDIDEKSLNQVGRWPWSRNVVADMVTKLTQHYKVKVVGFDVVFAEPDTSSGYETLEALAKKELKDIPEFSRQLVELKPTLDYDGRLAKALQGQPVVLGYVLSEKQKKGVLPEPVFTEEELNGRHLDVLPSTGYEANLPQLQSAARSGGFFSAEVDPDGVLRSSPLIRRVGSGYYEALSLAMLHVAEGATAVKPFFDRPVDGLSKQELEHYGLDALAMYTPARRFKIDVGDELKSLIQFRGRGGATGGAFRYVSAVDVLKGVIPQKDLEQRIVLVGTTAPGLNDLRATPVNSEYPGVEVHANLIKTMLEHDFKRQPHLRFEIDAAQILLIGLLLTLVLPALTPIHSMLLSVLTVGGIIGGNFLMFQYANWVMPMAAALLLTLGLFMINIVWGYLFEYRNRQAIVHLFGEYVAPELVAEMAEHPQNYNMEGESRELTVLFVDVRGFTTISEGLTPKALREYINIYLTAMSEDIRGNRGTLDKYIGDAVMAFWGAPVPLPDHASRAVASALLMQTTAHRLNDEFIARGWPPLKIGIGLNTGPMHVGDMGSAIRRAYTVMGDAVNLGSRLEGITKVYGVGLVVGELTKLAAPEYFYRELDCVRVKGKNEPIPIFEPLGLDATVDEQRQKAYARWHLALKLVRTQNWDDAEEILQGLHQLYPDEYLYELYLKRIVYYRGHPPGSNWDGVTTFDTK